MVVLKSLIRVVSILAFCSMLAGLGNGVAGAQGAAVRKGSSTKISPLLADLNNDGRPDVISIHAGMLSVLLGNGKGEFEKKGVYAIGSGEHAVVIGDLTQDGVQDIVVTNSETDDVSVLVGIGDGSFQNSAGVQVGRQPVEIQAADMNRDGQVDLIVALGAGRAITILLNRGNAKFDLGPQVTLPDVPSGLAAGDVNGDGRTDVIVQYSDGREATIHLGNGEGGLGVPTSGSVSGGKSGVVALADDKGPVQAVEPSTQANVPFNKALIVANGGVAFGGPLGELEQDTPNFFFDKSTKALGIRTSSPTATLHFAQLPTAGSQVIKLTPAEAAATSFSLSVAGFANPGDTRMNQVARLGWNLNYGGGQVDYTDGALGYEWESHYAPNSSRFFEHHMTYVSPQGLVHRPLSWMINKGTNLIEGEMRFNKLSFQTGGVAPTLAAAQKGPSVPARVQAAAANAGGSTAGAFTSISAGQTFSQWALFTPYQINLNGPSAIISNMNNVPMFFQLNSTASQYVALMKVDGNNRVVIAPGSDTARIPGALNIGAIEDTGLRRSTAKVLSVTDGGAGNGTVEAGGVLLVTQTAVTAPPTLGAAAKMYVKGGKLVVAYSDAGGVKYRYMDLASTNANWTYTTVAP